MKRKIDTTTELLGNGMFKTTDSEGTQKWWFQDQLHNEEGPAVVMDTGSRVWCVHGLYHRLDGPAFEYANGKKEYWIDGKLLTEAQFDLQSVLIETGLEELL